MIPNNNTLLKGQRSNENYRQLIKDVKSAVSFVRGQLYSEDIYPNGKSILEMSLGEIKNTIKNKRH